MPEEPEITIVTLVPNLTALKEALPAGSPALEMLRAFGEANEAAAATVVSALVDKAITAEVQKEAKEHDEVPVD